MNRDCTVYRIADLICKKWFLLIILELYKGEKWKRYTELKNRIPGITPKILSARLKELRKTGLLIKKVDSSTFPIKSEYCLTESGEDFVNIVKNVKKWSLKWKIKNSSCENKDCKVCEL